MLGYISRALSRFNYHPTRAQHSPHAWIQLHYGAATQFTESPDCSEPFPTAKITRLQQIIGVLLYYAQIIESTMLVMLSMPASAQSKGTVKTMQAATQLLNHCATHPNATIYNRASDMVLHIHSDASYLSASGSRSCYASYCYLSDQIGNTAPSPDAPAPTFNAPVLVNCAIIKAILSSAAEAKLGALFYNAKDGCMLHNTLIDLGYRQPPTSIQTDNLYVPIIYRGLGRGSVSSIRVSLFRYGT